jgi:hypothetical protein
LADVTRGGGLAVIDDSDKLKGMSLSIRISEKKAQIKQMELNKDNLDIERAKMTLQIDVLQEEVKIYEKELEQINNKLDSIPTKKKRGK